MIEWWRVRTKGTRGGQGWDTKKLSCSDFMLVFLFALLRTSILVENVSCIPVFDYFGGKSFYFLVVQRYFSISWSGETISSSRLIIFIFIIDKSPNPLNRIAAGRDLQDLDFALYLRHPLCSPFALQFFRSLRKEINKVNRTNG